MKRNLLAVLFLLAVALQPACIKKSTDGELQDATTPVTVELSRKDVTVCITARTPDVLERVVKTDGKERVAWKGHDGAYTIWFETAVWPFKESPDSTTADYKLIKVPSGDTSSSFTLSKRLESGQREEYRYRIDTDPASGIMPPPNGPAIIGEG